jgi:hypothetical protein
MPLQDTLVGKLWEPEFKDGKTVVILAGYTTQMQQMLQGNPGLQSRFSTTLMFEDWSDKNMTDLIMSNAADTKFVGPTPFVFHEEAVAELQNSLRQLRSCRDFGKIRAFCPQRRNVECFRLAVVTLLQAMAAMPRHF